MGTENGTIQSMSKILINKKKQKYINVKDILSFDYVLQDNSYKPGEIKIRLKNWKLITSDRKIEELFLDYYSNTKGGINDNMAKKPVKKGAKKGQ